MNTGNAILQTYRLSIDIEIVATEAGRMAIGIYASSNTTRFRYILLNSHIVTAGVIEVCRPFRRGRSASHQHGGNRQRTEGIDETAFGKNRFVTIDEIAESSPAEHDKNSLFTT